MKLWKKQMRVRMALILCVAMSLSIIGLPGQELAAQAVQVAQIREPEYPTGGLQEVDVYEVAGEEAEQVPSYENQITLFRRSSSIFDSGNGNYGYESLSASQQELYTSLEVSLQNFLRSETAEFTKVTYGYTPFKVSYLLSELDEEQLAHIWVAFRADHPWLFWLRGFSFSYGASEGQFMPLVAEAYENSVASVKEMNTVIENGVQQYLDAVEGVDDTYEKVRILYDKLIYSVNYAYQADGTTPVDEDWAHSVIGVFDSRYREVVCEGYSKAFSFLLNILDIPNIYITGTGNGGGHAWNAVSFDGGRTYYYMDVTWDDRGGKEEVLVENYYSYFAMPKDVFEKRHTVDTDGTDMNWQYALPVIGNDMDYTYYVRYGAYAPSGVVTDALSARTFLKAARVLAPGETCFFMLPDVNVLRTVVTALGVTGGYSYTPVEDYGMVLYADKAESFHAAAPANAFSLSDEAITIDTEMQTEQEITIASATDSSDDYITFYSSNEKVAVVKTPYVKAEAGERIRIAAMGKGTAVIHAKSAAGKAVATCTVSVDPDQVVVPPTPTPSERPSETPEPSAGAEETPEPEESREPGQPPSEMPEPSAGAEETLKPEEPSNPSERPLQTPGVTPSAGAEETPKPEEPSNPSERPLQTPGVTPSAGAEETPKPEEPSNPSERPLQTPANAGQNPWIPTFSLNPAPTVQPSTVQPPSDGEEDEISKGDIILSGNVKYKVSKIKGEKGELAVIGVKSKKPKTVTIANKIRRNGILFVVTSIQKNAFKGCKKVRTLNIKSTNIKSIAKKAFRGLAPKVKIKVPKSKAKAYKKWIKNGMKK